MEVGCVIFGMIPQKNQKDNIERWNELAIWQEFKPPFI
jgi:hypothetical protein